MTEEELFKNGYEVKEGKLLRYFGFCTSIKLPQEINVLGENCFAYNEDINSFTGSKNLKIIEQNAFYGCCNLERVCLCDGLERIEKSAFSSCGLKEIFIPQSFKEIEEKAFLECHSLNKIKLPETLESISDNLFDSCGELKRIDLPEHLISIGKESFAGCNKLESLTIPKSVVKIGDNAFGSYFSELRIKFNYNNYRQDENFIFGPDEKIISYIGYKSENEIAIPENTKSIGAFVFSRFSELESVIFPASVEEIDETAFMYNFDNLKFETQEKIKSIWLDMVQKRKQEQEFKMLNQFLDSCDK